MIRWPGQAYQDDAETVPVRLIWSPGHPVITAHICQWVGEWIPSMNNRLSLIFLGKPRPPILQLISGFLTLLIYGCIFLRETRVLLNALRLFLCPLQKVEWFSKARKMSMRKNVTKCVTSASLKYQLTLSTISSKTGRDLIWWQLM